MDNRDAPSKALHALDDSEMGSADRWKLHANDARAFSGDSYTDHMRRPEAVDLSTFAYTCAFCQERVIGQPIDPMKIIHAHYEASKTAKIFEEERARAANIATAASSSAATMDDDCYDDDDDEDGDCEQGITQELPWEFRCMRLPFHTCQPSHWVAASLLYVGEQSPIGQMIKETLPRFMPEVQGGEVLARYNSLRPHAEQLRLARMNESVVSANQQHFPDPPPSIPVAMVYPSSSAAAAGCAYPDDDDNEQMEQ